MDLHRSRGIEQIGLNCRKNSISVIIIEFDWVRDGGEKDIGP